MTGLDGRHKYIATRVGQANRCHRQDARAQSYMGRAASLIDSSCCAAIIFSLQLVEAFPGATQEVAEQAVA